MKYVVAVYYTIAFCFASFIFGKVFSESFREHRISDVFVSFFLLLASVLFVYINVSLLIGQNTLLRNLQICKWASFFQIFYISLIGVTYYFLVGITVLPYLSDSNDFSVGLSYEWFDCRFSAAYKDTVTIAAGFNLVPIIMFLICDYLIKAQRQEHNKTKDVPITQN